MKILIACEFSGVVRDEFLKLGHDAWSCDLLPSLSDNSRHYCGDVFDILYSEKWDMMIAHPPCQYLTIAGNRAFKEQGIKRERERDMAFKFAMSLYNAPISKICMENPVGYLNTHFRHPDQIIHPYMFGDPEIKRTCLWLRGLPKLYYSHPNARHPKPHFYWGNGDPVYYHDTAKIKGMSRSSARAKTFHGIAHAMAIQWGSDQNQYFINEWECV
jgi:site-specific DNA-cytosine methylase